MMLKPELRDNDNVFPMQEEQLSWHFDVNSSYVKHMKTRTRLTKSENKRLAYCIYKQSQWCTCAYKSYRINIIMKLNRYEKIIKGIVESRKGFTKHLNEIDYHINLVKNMTIFQIFVYEKIDICRSNKRVRIIPEPTEDGSLVNCINLMQQKESRKL